MDAAGSNSGGMTPVNVRIAEGRAYEEAKRLEVDRQFARQAAEGHRQSEAGRVQEQARIAKEGVVRLSAFTARQQSDQTARARFEDAAHAAGAQKQEGRVAELRRIAGADGSGMGGTRQQAHSLPRPVPASLPRPSNPVRGTLPQDGLRSAYPVHQGDTSQRQSASTGHADMCPPVAGVHVRPSAERRAEAPRPAQLPLQTPVVPSVVQDGQRREGVASSAHQHLHDAFQRFVDPSTKDRENRSIQNAVRGTLRLLDREGADGPTDERRRELQHGVATILNELSSRQRHTAEYSYALKQVSKAAAEEVRRSAELQKENYRNGIGLSEGSDLNQEIHTLNRASQNAQKFSDSMSARHNEQYGSYKFHMRKLTMSDGAQWDVKDREKAVLEASQAGKNIPPPEPMVLESRYFSLETRVLEAGARNVQGWQSEHQRAASQRDNSFDAHDAKLSRLADYYRSSDVNRPISAEYVDRRRDYLKACRERDISADRLEMLERSPYAAQHTREIEKTRSQVFDLGRDVNSAKQFMDKAWTAYKESGEGGVFKRNDKGERMWFNPNGVPNASAVVSRNRSASGKEEGGAEQQGRGSHAPVDIPPSERRFREQMAAADAVENRPTVASW